MRVNSFHFYFNSADRDRSYFSGSWASSTVQLSIRSIQSVRFTTPLDDTKREAEVIFRDGKRQTFIIHFYGTNSRFTGKSPYGPWKIHVADVARIEFLLGEEGIRNDNQAPASMISPDFDEVTLKNGDVVSGRITTDNFNIRASYGELQFEASQITSIEFEGGGQNIDVLRLKSGDKISGTVETKNIKLTMVSGNIVTLSSDKVKFIRFAVDIEGTAPPTSEPNKTSGGDVQ